MKRRQKRSPVLLIGAAVITGLVCMAAGWGSYRFLTSPRTWFGTVPYRIAVASTHKNDQFWQIIEYFPTTSRVAVVSLPTNVSIPVLNKGGQYRVGSLLQVAELYPEQKQFVEKSLTQALSLPIRGVITINGTSINSSAEALALSKQMGWRWLKQALKTGNQLPEAYALWLVTSHLTPRQIHFISLNEEPIFRTSTDVDGQAVRQIEPLSLKTYFARIHQVDLGERQSFTVTVENDTQVLGIAQETADLLTSDGWDVVNVSDGRTPLPDSYVYVKNEKMLGGPAVKELHWYFPQAEFQADANSDYRSEIVVRLGVKGRGN